MDDTSIAPTPIVLPADEQSEIHIGATQSGNRQIDIRVWRRGPAGFAPSRNALDVNPPDLDVLRAGVRRLLDEGGGSRAVRVVLEGAEDRRLRAETEPFGTRYLAKLVFWQRVRDSWRPVDDGLIVGAEVLPALLEAVDRFVPWLEGGKEPPKESGDEAMLHHVSHRWPKPGADWMTVEPRRVIFHPRGVRITCAIEETGGVHHVSIQQWQRQETLWLTTGSLIALDMVALDTVLGRIRALDAGPSAQVSPAEEEKSPLSPVQVATEIVDGKEFVVFSAGGEGSGAVAVPRAEIGRFGRALLQTGSMLARALSPLERKAWAEVQEQRPSLASYEAEEPSPQISQESARESGTQAGGYPSIREIFGTPVTRAPLPDGSPQGGSPQEAPPRRSNRQDDPPRSSRPRRVVPLPPREQSREIHHPDRGEAPSPPDDERPLDETPAGPVLIPVQDIQLDHHRVRIGIFPEGDGRLSLQWEGKSLVLPLDHLAELISDLRDLYYDSLRGRRGRPITISAISPVTVSVLHQGTQLYFALTQETEGAGTHLSFPAHEVPVFLDAARAALSTAQGAVDE